MPTVDFTWLFIKMMAVLAAICVGAVLVLRYVVPRLPIGRRMARSQQLQVLTRVPLGGRRDLWLVRVGQRYFLLGAGDPGVRCLAELSASDVGESR
ncbi:MAG: FliO/MopB family protein [Deltaproteobacteria bacterium]|nr:FliO/MopB family protein [Deltaproteobacteria bacterium]